MILTLMKMTVRYLHNHSSPQPLRDETYRYSIGELKLSAEAHFFGELKLPSSQTMLISHCRRKHCSFAIPLGQGRSISVLAFDT